MLNVLYLYISTFRSMCAVPNMALIVIIIIIIIIIINAVAAAAVGLLLSFCLLCHVRVSLILG